MNPRDAKERLAREVVDIYHGAEAAEQAAEEFRRVFSQKELPEEIPGRRVAGLRVSRTGGSGWWICLYRSASRRARVRRGGSSPAEGSPSTARRSTDTELELTPGQIDGKVIRKGRKTFIRVEIIGDS